MKLMERAKQLGNNIALMENREKGDLSNILDRVVTIEAYDFMKDEKGEEYVVFTVREDKENFYFGGSVLTEQMIELHTDGYHDEIVKDGLPVLLGRKMSKAKREYTTVKFFPN